MNHNNDYPSLSQIKRTTSVAAIANIFNYVGCTAYGVLSNTPEFTSLGALSGIATLAIIDIAKPQIIEARRAEERRALLKNAGFEPRCGSK